MSVKLPDQPNDPNLVKAMEEIKLIVKRYDVAAAVILEGKTHSEIWMEVSPSWSCITLETQPDGSAGIRFKAKLKTGDDAEKERGRLSIGVVIGLLDSLGHLHEQFTKVVAMIGQKVGIEHVSQFHPRGEP
jgi:hypothetical protein